MVELTLGLKRWWCNLRKHPTATIEVDERGFTVMVCKRCRYIRFDAMTDEAYTADDTEDVSMELLGDYGFGIDSEDTDDT